MNALEIETFMKLDKIKDIIILFSDWNSVVSLVLLFWHLLFQDITADMLYARVLRCNPQFFTSSFCEILTVLRKLSSHEIMLSQRAYGTRQNDICL